jgi:hypothetical protein
MVARVAYWCVAICGGDVTVAAIREGHCCVGLCVRGGENGDLFVFEPT